MIQTNQPESAFPSTFKSLHPEEQQVHRWGMQLRDYFAAKAMQGILSNKGVFSDDSDQSPVNFDGWMFEDCAKCAYEMADAMLIAREAT